MFSGDIAVIMIYNYKVLFRFHNLTLVLLLFISLITSGYCVFERFYMTDTDSIEELEFGFKFKSKPLVINTWAFTDATKRAWDLIRKSYYSPIEAVQQGCSVCEEEQCDFTVGFGGSPDENGETTLDAMIMDGNTMNVGAVAGLRRVKNAIGVARHVMENTKHSILVGDLATKFALDLKFKEESLSTNKSTQVWKNWKSSNCQPNFWQNVSPDPAHHCGPYTPNNSSKKYPNVQDGEKRNFNRDNHDTISMIVLDNNGRIAVGTSSNGANHKIPGRIGDAPIPGAGAYADAKVGAAAATGDGDIMMRFLPSFLAVEEMRNGKKPREAVTTAILRIASKYPNFFGAIIAVNAEGKFAATCNGMKEFQYSVVNRRLENITVKRIPCFNPPHFYDV